MKKYIQTLLKISVLHFSIARQYIPIERDLNNMKQYSSRTEAVIWTCSVKKRCLQKLCKIHRKISQPESPL